MPAEAAFTEGAAPVIPVNGENISQGLGLVEGLVGWLDGWGRGRSLMPQSQGVWVEEKVRAKQEEVGKKSPPRPTRNSSSLPLSANCPKRMQQLHGSAGYLCKLSMEA